MMIGKNSQSSFILDKIPENSIGIELGVWKGESSEKFIKKCRKLHLVDSWEVAPYVENDENGTFEDYLKKYKVIVGSEKVEDFKLFYEKIYSSVVEKFKNKNVIIHKMTTNDFFKNFNEIVDWVYVDAAHDFDGCLKDLENSLKIVKKGGVILGDDYLNKPGVRKAVDKFVKKHSLPFDNFYKSQYEIKVI